MKQVIVTTSWDDGHVLDLKLAELLKKYGIKTTFYIAPKNREIPIDERLTNNQIRELSKDFEIGAHTMTHPNLTMLDCDVATEEIFESKRYLESVVDKKVESFCYPYGEYNIQMQLLVRTAGFAVARNVTQMTTEFPKDLLELGTSIEFSPSSLRGFVGKCVLAIRHRDAGIIRSLSLNQEQNIREVFDYVYKNGGIFHLWGHSALIDQRNEFDSLENILSYISSKNGVTFVTNGEIATLSKSNTERLNIVQTPVRYHPFIGGVEKYVQDLSTQLVEIGNEVTVYCADEPNSGKNDEQPVKVRRLPYILKVANTNITPRLPIELVKASYDLIHTHIPTPWSADFSAFISMLKRKPLVVTYHNDILSSGIFKIIAQLYNYSFLRFVLWRAAAVIVTQKRYINSSLYLSRYRSKIVVIPNGIDTRSVEASVIAKEKNTISFLSVLDRYHTYKGLDVLLKAVALIKLKNKDIKLIVGGSGDLLDMYKEQVASLKIDSNVVFLGRLEEERKNEFFQRSSAFILPSIGYEEGFGIVLLEALSNRVPVITTKFAGVAEDIKKHNVGYVVEENNAEILAEKISSILSNQPLAYEMGERGHNLAVNKYSYEKIARQMDMLYRLFV